MSKIHHNLLLKILEVLELIIKALIIILKQ